MCGAAELRSEWAIWTEQAPFDRHIHAEAAFSVETEYRRRGIGEKLFKRILRAATNHGVETIEIVCLPDNIGMRRLAQKFKTQFTFEENSLTGRLTARRPTAVLADPGSLHRHGGLRRFPVRRPDAGLLRFGRQGRLTTQGTGLMAGATRPS